MGSPNLKHRAFQGSKRIPVSKSTDSSFGIWQFENKHLDEPRPIYPKVQRDRTLRQQDVKQLSSQRKNNFPREDLSKECETNGA